MSACDCGYAERNAQNREDWDIKNARTSWFEATGANGKPWPPYPVWHWPTCASLEDYPFEPNDAERACPKCRSTDVLTSWHDAGWSYTPHHHDYWRTDLYKWRCLLTHRYRPVEHLDETCHRCGFQWLLAVAPSVTPLQVGAGVA